MAGNLGRGLTDESEALARDKAIDQPFEIRAGGGNRRFLWSRIHDRFCGGIHYDILTDEGMSDSKLKTCDAPERGP